MTTTDQSAQPGGSQPATFKHQPASVQEPGFVTTHPATNSLPPRITTALSDLLIDVGGMCVEHLAMRRFLQKEGLWEAFQQYFDWEWTPDGE